MDFDPVAVAAINATVLALILGGATAYALIHLQALQEMTTELLDAASNIQYLRWTTFIGDPMEYDSTDPDARSRLVDGIVKGAMGLDGTDSEAGKRLLSRICTLCMGYPFSPSGLFAVEGQAWPPSELNLDTETAIAQWAVDMQFTLASLQWATTVHWDKVMEVVTAYDVGRAAAPLVDPRMRNQLTPGARKDLDRLLHSVEVAGQKVAGNFRELLQVASQTTAAVQAKHARIVRYRRRLVKPRVLFVGLLIGTILFGMGVIVPMLDPNASSLFVAWIPGLFYLALLLAALAWFVITFARRGNVWR